MAGVFKSVQANDYSVTQFPAYYDYSYTYQSGSTTNSPDVQIFYATKYVTSSSEIRSPRVSNFEYDLFDSIVQNFYSQVPYAAYGINSASYVPTSGSVYVISVTQNLFGEKIVPSTFSFQINASSSYDDGKGNLIVSQSGIESIVGRIFYDKGIVVMKPTSSLVNGGISLNGVSIPSASVARINFTSSLKLYEHSLRVTLEPTEFLRTFSNATILRPASGSSTTPFALMVSGSLLPYVTALGFYNSNKELIAVAKPSVPIQRTSDMPQTFIVKFDIY